jgi:Neuraminidase (sialidase)
MGKQMFPLTSRLRHSRNMLVKKNISLQNINNGSDESPEIKAGSTDESDICTFKRRSFSF